MLILMPLRGLKNSVWIKTYENLKMILFGVICVILSSSNACPLPISSGFLPISFYCTGLNLVKRFFTGISRAFFLGFLNFEFLSPFLTFQKFLRVSTFFGIVGGSMVQTFSQLSFALQVWNLVKSFFTGISRGVMFWIFEFRIFSHFFEFSKSLGLVL